jgi:hypothetical protein
VVLGLMTRSNLVGAERTSPRLGAFENRHDIIQGEFAGTVPTYFGCERAAQSWPFRPWPVVIGGLTAFAMMP